jgi:isopenicillin-N epimerase
MIGPNAKTLFPLDSAVTYLDHGGFGVLPHKLREAQRRRQDEIEANPKAFFAYRWPEAWRSNLQILATRLRVEASNLTFVENATDGINSALRSLRYGPGDEILVTSQTYGAVEIAAREIAQGSGAVVTRAALPFPVTDSAPSDYVDIVARAITSRTKLAILDHIASPTSLVTPIEQMVAECRQRGVAVLVDGAHAPGQIPLDIQGIDADWYVGNLHKWAFAPRPLGFMWAADSRLEQTTPAVLSWGARDAYSFRFNWAGTRDVSPVLCAPDAFAFMDEFGEAEVIAHNRNLIREAIALLAEAWKAATPTPDAMIGSMATLPLPAGLSYPADEAGCAALQKLLILEKGISAAVPFAAGGRLYIRIAAQIYNDRSDYVRLSEAVLNLR